jgi:hypothetical protein
MSNPIQTQERMKSIIRDAIAFAEIKDTALVAMLMPGHGIPLTHTCGAVLDHDLIRMVSPVFGWESVVGNVVSEDELGSPITASISLRNIVWVSPEIKEVK